MSDARSSGSRLAVRRRGRWPAASSLKEPLPSGAMVSSERTLWAAAAGSISAMRSAEATMTLGSASPMKYSSSAAV